MSADGFGTSFAAARMSRMVAVTRAFLLEVAANIDRLAGRPFGVPLVGVEVVDRRFAPQPPDPPGLSVRALPVLATVEGAIDLVPATAADALARYLEGPGGPSAARYVLQAAAKATSPTPETRLSAPSLTPRRLTDFLDGLTAPWLLENLLNVTPDGGRAAARLFPPGTADRLRLLVQASMPICEWALDTRTARMRHHPEHAHD
jgi:hypothetical protein